MTDLQVGRILRALRRRLRLTPRQLGLRVAVSQQTISLIERGRGARLSTETLRRVFAAVDARWEPTVSWRGGALDRSSRYWSAFASTASIATATSAAPATPRGSLPFGQYSSLWTWSSG